MTRIHVRGGKPLAGYAHAGMRIVVVRGDYEARVVEHLFPHGFAPEQALEIDSAHGANPLFVRCAEYINEVEWSEFPDGGHPYFVPA
ncbi:hypothetical protein G3N95_14765 [Paraburkholderia sp. Tr-20389]|uniref:hypothetical protein n=1 Tax=Paraburkholderia sp. Tr-20389 TaxID=2703903 RepID=UPI00197E0125|nr:hypothetical protein [Paraburkholderia sp. Tr-20389]MBN3754211.1 hypothetical protein [Paraburkholderia sp. Tr-20389]